MNWNKENKNFSPEQIAEVFQNIRWQRPLIHMIPNGVSAALCADGLSALGARPLMAVAPEEMKEIVSQADASVVNLGQLNQEKLAAARLVLAQGEKLGKPLVLDPVGCGASAFRLHAVQELLSLPWQGIIKGNRSELYSIQQELLTKEGIDSLENRCLTEEVRTGSVYLVTGKTDCVMWEDGKLEIVHKGSRPYNIVGSGCLAGAVAGACYSMTGREPENRHYSSAENTVDREPRDRLAAVAASFGMAFALEQTTQSSGYGSAKVKLLDGLNLLSEEIFLDWLKRRMI